MKGHVYRRTRPDGSRSRWYAVIDLPASPTGARRQQTSTHDTRREAQAWLAQRVQELRAGETYDTRVTTGEFLTSWLVGNRALRASTEAEYARHINTRLIPALGHLRLLDLRAHHIETMFAEITAKNPTRERPIGPTTMRRIYATLNSALNTAVRRGLIRRNPATTVTLPQPNAKPARAWTPELAQQFLEATKDDRLWLLYRLLILTGLRRGEAAGLRWSDVDLNTATLRVRRQVTVVTGEVIIGPPKSKAGNRTVALDKTTVDHLRRLRVVAELAHDPNTADFTETSVFEGPGGRPLHPAYVTRHFNILVRRYDFPPLRLHDLRHTSASIGLASGESLVEVSQRLGHSSIAITADVYSHVSPVTAQVSAQRLAERVDLR
jgi:integrase